MRAAPKLTPKEAEAVNQLRENVKSEIQPDYDTDFNLLRWLQHTDFDLKKATTKLKHSLKARAVLQIKPSNDIWTGRDRIFAESYPFGVLGPCGTGENYIVNLCQFGRYDCAALRKRIMQTKTALGYTQDCEDELRAIMEKEAETGEQWEQLTLIDLEDMVVDRYILTGPFLQLVRFVFDNYPKMIRKAVIINAPSVFYYFWKVIGPILPLHGVHVHFLSHKWREEIKEHIHPDCLPVSYGGNLVDNNGDAKCSQWIRMPTGVVPEEKWWKPSEKDQQLMKELEKLNVSPGKAEYITMKVDKPNTEISWYFITHSWFSFGIYFTENENERNPDNMSDATCQYPVMDATYVPESGSLLCPKPGFYKLRFGNENSRFRKLHVEIKTWKKEIS